MNLSAPVQWQSSAAENGRRKREFARRANAQKEALGRRPPYKLPRRPSHNSGAGAVPLQLSIEHCLANPQETWRLQFVAIQRRDGIQNRPPL